MGLIEQILNTSFLIALALLIAEIIAINIHELGHAFFAKKFNFRVLKYQFLFWIYDLETKKWNVKLKNKNVGSVTIDIPTDIHNKWLEYSIIHLGGIIFNTVQLVLYLMIFVCLWYLNQYSRIDVTNSAFYIITVFILDALYQIIINLTEKVQVIKTEYDYFYKHNVQLVCEIIEEDEENNFIVYKQCSDGAAFRRDMRRYNSN